MHGRVIVGRRETGSVGGIQREKHCETKEHLDKRKRGIYWRTGVCVLCTSRVEGTKSGTENQDAKKKRNHRHPVVTQCGVLFVVLFAAD